jgi:predicted PurR-regulated permease PerM
MFLKHAHERSIALPALAARSQPSARASPPDAALSMLSVGIFISVGLTMLGVPLGLILGIIAGLLDFIPYVGPIIAGVPAVLIALSMGPDMALYVILLFLVVQTIEEYILQPLVEARAVELPPALTIVTQLIFGMLMGFAGVALATPLTATLMVLVNMLYIEYILGDERKRDEQK